MKALKGLKENPWKFKSRNAIFALTLIILFFLIVQKYRMNDNGRVTLQKEHFIDNLEEETLCEITDINDICNLVRSRRKKCLQGPILDLLELTTEYGDIMVPETFRPQVQKWLGRQDLYEKVLHQPLLKVFNKLTKTMTAYNPLRASRPLPKMKQDPEEFVRDKLQKSESECDFCRFRTHTAEDIFGRVESANAASAANTFKIQAFHSLIFPKRHSILDLSFDEFSDVFRLSHQWFRKVHEASPKHAFPNMIYDSLDHAGASQIHPHLHVFMSENNYDGLYRILEESNQEYFRQTGRNFLEDYIQAHIRLGLGIKMGSAAIIVPLDAHKDHEFVIISKDLDEAWIKAFFMVLQTYIEELGVFCWSSSFAFPPLGESRLNRRGLPAIGRMGSRGNCQSLTSDASSFELYLMNNVNSNPFETMKALKKKISETS